MADGGAHFNGARSKLGCRQNGAECRSLKLQTSGCCCSDSCFQLPAFSQVVPENSVCVLLALQLEGENLQKRPYIKLYIDTAMTANIVLVIVMQNTKQHTAIPKSFVCSLSFTCINLTWQPVLDHPAARQLNSGTTRTQLDRVGIGPAYEHYLQYNR